MRVFTAAGKLVRFFPHRATLASERARVATAGDGGFVWIQDPFETYRVDSRRLDDGSLVESFDGALVTGANLSRVMLANPPTETIGELTIFEVGGTSHYPRLRRVPAENYVSSQFSVDAAGNWASVGNRGEVYASKTDASIPPLALGCGRPLAIAGARDRVAVLTSDGRIRVFDLVNGQRRWLRTLDVLQDSYSADLAFAAEGRYLVVHRKLRGDVQSRAPIDVFDLAGESARFTPATPAHAHFGLFTMEPDAQERLLELARTSAPSSIGTPGLLSINFHRSLDGRQVVNLGAWSDFDGFAELLTRPGFKEGEPYWQGVAGFQNIFFDVAAVVTAP